MADHGNVAFDDPVHVVAGWRMRGTTLGIAIEGDLCTWAVQRLQPVLLDLLVALEPAKIIMDLSKVTFADARAASMLIHVDRLATIRAARLEIAAPAAAVLRLLELTDLRSALDVSLSLSCVAECAATADLPSRAVVDQD